MNDFGLQNNVSRRSILSVTTAGLLTTILLPMESTAQQGGTQIWAFEIGNPVVSSPTVVDGTVFVGSWSFNDKSLYAVDAETGNQQWAFDTEQWVTSSPTVIDGTVFFGSHPYLYAVDAETGNQQWAFDTGNSLVRSSPTVVDGTVFVGSGGFVEDSEENEGTLHAVDAETGGQQWSFTEPDDEVESSPTVVDGTVFVGSKDGNIYAVDYETGDQQWVFTEADNGISSSPTVMDGTVFVGSTDGNIYAVDAETGNQQWASQFPSYIYSSPTVADNTVFVGTNTFDENSGFCHALDAETGDQQWVFTEPTGDVRSSPTVVNGSVIIGSMDGNLYAIDAESGDQQWVFTESNGPISSSPTVVNGTVFIGSSGGNIYAVNAGVTGSSEGSRVMLGTLGHHGEWYYNRQSIDVSVTALYTSWMENHIELIALGAGGVGGGYMLWRGRSNQSQERGSLEESFSEATDTTFTESNINAEENPNNSEKTEAPDPAYVSSVSENLTIKAKQSSSSSECSKYLRELEDTLKDSNINSSSYNSILDDLNDLIVRVESDNIPDELDDERIRQIEDIAHRIKRLCQRES